MADEEEIFTVTIDARMERMEKVMLQAANKTDANLNRIEKKFSHTNNRLRKGLEFRGFDTGSARAFRDVEKRMNGLKGMLLGGVASLGVGFGFTELANALKQDEEAARRLEAVLKTTGYAAGLSQRDIAKWADELEQRTGRGAGEVQKVAAQLATFTSIGRNEFLKVIEIADDLSATFGGDLQNNLDAVARALDDPIKGFASLQKRGFSLADSELKRVKAHLAAGEAAKAQGIILENLSKQVKGAAEATNQGLTKALNVLRKQAGDTFKAFADGGGTATLAAGAETASKALAVLAEHHGTLLVAVQAVAAFIATKHAVVMGAATLEMLNQAAAAVKAKGAIEALNAALTKNAVGLAALGVAALVFALSELDRRHKEAVREGARLEKSQVALKAATDAYAIAAGAAAAATGAEAKAKREAAQRTREAAIASRDAALAKVGEAKATLALLTAENLRRIQWENAPGGNRGDAPGTRPRNAGQIADLQVKIDEQQKLVSDAIASIADSDRLLKSTGTTGVDYEDKKDKNAAKKAEARRRAVEDLKAEIDLQEAQLTNDVDRVRALEREASVRQRARALIDAEVTKDKAAAAAQAEAMQKRLDAARAIQLTEQERVDRRDRDRALWEIDERPDLVRKLEREAELEERIAFWREKDRDLVTATSIATRELAEMDQAREAAAKRNLDLAREQHAITVAQLSGNARLTRQLQDQAEIKARTKTYQGDDYRLGAVDAERRATEEVTRERVAATYGQHRDLFASAFSDGIRAALAGDLQGFLSNQFGNFADMAFKKAGEEIYDAVFGGVSAISDGATQGAAMAATVTPAITGAGTAVAAEWVAAITSAGTAAGAAMAASISAANASAFLRLPGFDRGGYTGPGAVNQVAGVAHKGEVVFSQKDVARHGGPAAVDAMRRGLPGYSNGGIVGRLNAVDGSRAAMKRLGQISTARQEMLLRLVVDEGPLFAPRVEKIAGPISVQTAATGVAYSQSQARDAAQRRRQSFVG